MAYSSQSKMDGKRTHLDMEFTGELSRGDDESVRALKRFLLAFLRCGRLEDAKRLLEHAGLPALSPFISIRQFVTNPVMSPIDPMHDNHYLARSRLFFKRTAKDLLSMVTTLILIILGSNQ